ncbi:uncharacterized protein PITG_01130 [Phytophthora infestans T30-4]|uniref:Uncharacterized protein n=1 Tax=Phytophthora infestans (strain T30-4) TaxID=403677 RepID=D0MSJ3_PHYIT|nr:uncharacterized protein PITG_01130 [Phytophthora infestans T30-4]EEY58462.1 conserved hypothetical protein [Phytophthora infestans T30-4]|eukprot:XP_002909648.1 conserved hypothetical protein [Phytophthora infestans T30-4]
MGETCKLQEVQCITAPCNPVPTCVPIENPPPEPVCAKKCPKNERCQINSVDNSLYCLSPCATYHSKSLGSEFESEGRSEPPPEPPSPPEIVAIADLLDEVYAEPKQRRMHYTMKKKRHALIATQGLSQRETATSQKIPRWTLTSWRKSEDDIFAFKGSEKTLSRAPGRREIIPFSAMLVTFMKETRRESLPLTASLMAAKNWKTW